MTRRNRLSSLAIAMGLAAITTLGAQRVVVGSASPSSAPDWDAAPSLPVSDGVGDGVAFVLGDTLYHVGGWAGNANQRLGVVYGSALSDGIPSTWSVTAILNPSRFGATVAVYNGRAYVIGGYGGSLLDRIDVFDSSTLVWTSAGSLPQALNFPTAAVVEGRLYVAGGLPNPNGKTWSAPIQADGRVGAWREESFLSVGNQITRLAAAENCL